MIALAGPLGRLRRLFIPFRFLHLILPLWYLK